LCAKSILAQLCNIQTGLHLQADDVRLLLAPKDRLDEPQPHVQYHGIDVYLRILCKDGRTLSIIIENKTRTGAHDDQLKRYRDTIKGLVPEDGDPVCLYFKTGYVFDFERKHVEDQGYSVLGAEDMLGLLATTGMGIAHALFHDYVDHLGRITGERERVLRTFEETSDPCLLNHDYCQYELMKRLRTACDCAQWNIGMEVTTPAQWYTYADIHPGTDHGRPWTSLVFACFPDMYGGQSEVLAYRLQMGGTGESPNPELVLQQYAWWEGNHPDFEARKTARRDRLRSLFREICPTGGLLLERGVRNRGRYASEIAAFCMTDARARELLMTHLPAMHQGFVKRVQRTMTG
jgi:hypothetical protein